MEQLIPQFNLGDEDIPGSTDSLAGFGERKVPHPPAGQSKRSGRSGGGGTAAGASVQLYRLSRNRGPGADLSENTYQENPTLRLRSQWSGEKVQSNWLFGFLKAPIPIRPWLELRMPTFGLSDAHTGQLVDYFNGLSKVEFPFTLL